MVERKKGTIIVTSSTAAVRGNEQQHSHAAAMGGRRMLCQTLNAEFGPKGIHIAHVIVDGAVEAPDTLRENARECGVRKIKSRARWGKKWTSNPRVYCRYIYAFIQAAPINLDS